MNQQIDKIGWYFVQEYYTTLNKEPLSLHRFYMKDSTFVHGVEGESADPYTGQTEIHKKIISLDFIDCKVLVSNVDSQPSFKGGIMIQVIGEMSNNNMQSNKFAQTFFLSTQASGYYVLNDMFRYLKEDVDTLYEQTVDPITKPTESVSNSHPRPASPSKSPQMTHSTHTSADQFTLPSKPTPTLIEKNAIKAIEKMTNGKLPVQTPLTSHHDTQSVSSEKYTLETQDTQHASRPVSPQKQQPKPTTAAARPPTAPSSERSNASMTESLTGAAKVPAKTTPTATTSIQPITEQTAPSVVEPPKPKSWASLAASNVQQPMSRPRPNTVNPNTERPTSSATNGHTNTSKHSSAVHSSEDREKFSVYIRSLAVNTTEQQLTAAFGSLGTIVSVELFSAKNVAFIEFSTTDSCQAAIGKSATVNGKTVLLEERLKRTKKNGGYSGSADYKKNNNNTNYSGNREGKKESNQKHK